MITMYNYFEQIQEVDFSHLPQAMKEGHELLVEATNEGKDLSVYKTDESVKEVIDLYLEKLNDRLATKKADGSKQTKQKAKPSTASDIKAHDANEPGTPKKRGSKTWKLPSQDSSEAVANDLTHVSTAELKIRYDELKSREENGEELESEERQEKSEAYREINRRVPKSSPGKIYAQDIRPETEYERWRIEFRDLENMSREELESELEKVIDVLNYNGLTDKEKKYLREIETLLKSGDGPILTERIPEELRYIRRFVNLHEKTKTKDEILRFINSLQKAIVEKRIRRTSAYAEQIRYIQDALIHLYNGMGRKKPIELKPDIYTAMKKLTGDEKIMPSINFIKRYISLNGKIGIKEKAKQLLNQINRAYEKGKITDNDSYIIQIHEIKKQLKAFTMNKGVKALEIAKAELNGLQGLLGCACQQFGGLGEVPAVMNSMEFAKVKFDTLGFRGKWLNLIGDPSRNFTAMVYGKPKFGKSTLCLDFAHYLASNHGRVLYVAKEEGLDTTLQRKINEFGFRHPNLAVAAILPDDKGLSAFDFIFLDSVNRLGLNPDDLHELKAKWPTKSFVFIFQTTKEGKFRGANSFQHDVDIVVEVPEWGKAVQMGRFNQGGTMAIFSEEAA